MGASGIDVNTGSPLIYQLDQIAQTDISAREALYEGAVRATERRPRSMPIPAQPCRLRRPSESGRLYSPVQRRPTAQRPRAASASLGRQAKAVPLRSHGVKGYTRPLRQGQCTIRIWGRAVEQSDKRQVPDVIYANLISANLTTDDFILEFWEHVLGYAVKPMSAEDVAKTDAPVARIVVPFASAKWLKDYLDQAVPKAEENRKAGK